MGDIQVRHFAPQEFVEFELSSREPMQVRIAYLGQAPDGRASVAIEVRYAGDREVAATLDTDELDEMTGGNPYGH